MGMNCERHDINHFLQIESILRRLGKVTQAIGAAVP
jgi:hypothetical protein